MTASSRNGTRTASASSALPMLATALLALLLVGAFPSASYAATRSFSPVAIQHAVAVFRPHHVEPQAVASARVRLGAETHSLPAATVRKGIRSGTLRVAVPARDRSIKHSAVKLRLTLRSRWSKHQSETSTTSPTPTPSPTPAPDESTTEPTNAPAPAPEPEAPPAPESNKSGESPSSSIEIPANALYVSPTGSDTASGSATAPWRTLAKAVVTASAGDVVVLEPGTYGAMGTTTNFSRSGTTAAPIVFTSAPGKARAVIRGYVHITASHLRLDSIVFDGPTGTIVSKSSSNPNGEEVQVSIMGSTDVELSHSEVRDNAWHAGVFVSRASNVRVVSNYVHDNGDAATGANLDHGIYWCSGSGMVGNNVVEGNVAYGIQLYPSATNVVVRHNTVTGSGRGGIIVSRESTGNELLGNLVANNAEYGIRGYELSGAGNVARDNLLWNNRQNTYGSGISFSGTVVADPKQMSAATLSAYGAL